MSCSLTRVRSSFCCFLLFFCLCVAHLFFCLLDHDAGPAQRLTAVSMEQTRHRRSHSLSNSATVLSTLYVPALASMCVAMEREAKAKLRGAGRGRSCRKNLHYFDSKSIQIDHDQRCWLSQTSLLDLDERGASGEE